MNSRAIRRNSTASPAIRSSRMPYAGQAPVSESDEKTWGIISHISIPFFGFIGPLIAYLVYKDRSEWLKQTTTEALNFSILYSIAYLIAVITIVGRHRFDLVAAGVHRRADLLHPGHDRGQQARVLQVPDQHTVH